MTETERVWAHIKLAAENLADSGVSVVAYGRAEEIVRHIIYEEHAEPPPADALAFFAEELRAFVAHYSKRATSSSIQLRAE